MPHYQFNDLHVLIRPQSDGEKLWWTAQCLEWDICAQAETIDELEHEFGRVFAGRIAAGHELGVDPFKHLEQAPKAAWDAWETAREVEIRASKPFARRNDGLAPWMMSPRYEARLVS